MPQVAVSPTYNYTHVETRGPALLIVNAVFIGVVVLVVMMRFWTRAKITGSFGADDVLIGLAVIPAIGLTAAILLADRKYGWNRHLWDLHLSQLRHGLQLQFAGIILFTVASYFTKLSLLAFYRRLLTSSNYKVFNFLLISVFILWTAMFLWFLIDYMRICRPIPAFWDNIPPLAKPTYPFVCIDSKRAMFIGSVVNSIQDFAMIILPIPIVWKLKLPVRQRMIVISLFCLGIIVVVAGGLKLLFLISMNRSIDKTWGGWPLWIATAVEIDIGILCASAPALRPFFAKYFPRLLNRTRSLTRSRSSRARSTPNPQVTFEFSQPPSYPKSKPPLSRDPYLNSSHGIPRENGWICQSTSATAGTTAKVSTLAQIAETNVDIEMDDLSGIQTNYGYAYGSDDDRFSIEPALVPRVDGGGSPAGNDSYEWRSYNGRDLSGHNTQTSGSNISYDGRGNGSAISYDVRASDINDGRFDRDLQVHNGNQRNETFYRNSSCTAS